MQKFARPTVRTRSMQAAADDGIFKGELELYVYDRKELQDLFQALKKIEEIKVVKRIETNNS